MKQNNRDRDTNKRKHRGERTHKATTQHDVTNVRSNRQNKQTNTEHERSQDPHKSDGRRPHSTGPKPSDVIKSKTKFETHFTLELSHTHKFPGKRNAHAPNSNANLLPRTAPLDTHGKT
jgi:hypothetical protein